MRAHLESVVDASQLQGCVWSDLSTRVQFSVGLLNGMAAFFVAMTFAWTHQSWHIYQISPLLSNLVAGVTMTGLMKRLHWRTALTLSILAGLLVLIVLGVLLSTPLGMTIVTAFTLMVSAGLALPYVLQVDVGDGCVLNLRFMSAIAAVGVIIYVLNDAPLPSSVTPLNIVFTLVMSVGIMVGQLAFTRHVQAVATHLNQDSLVMSGAGVLTLALLFGSVGPFVAIGATFAICAVLALILLPVLWPAIQWVMVKIKSHPIYRTPQQAPEHVNKPNQLPQPIQHAGTAHWIVWAVIVLILFSGTLFFILRRRQAEKSDDSEQVRAAKVTSAVIKRDRNIDVFRLEETDDPVRRQYQKRLKQWNDHGHPIGRWESPREFLDRLPSDELREEDERLTTAYERVRYGQSSSRNEV
ncbi:DUF4129 domain-containing protein [Alicyclobacillus dauci]|uniref:DUF4129 domain-containing protein n=1 Tax=Alicyclobacillus dauci TaxID=1475485 RepID=A0ABY6Z7Z7_9BACL|nr:DUF4129 domain-containing protein [Alicyclobacillus dauci]WAH38369.1 DUF4129 domain-containing protein [Alicyclobacillus dauci]